MAVFGKRDMFTNDSLGQAITALSDSSLDADNPLDAPPE